MCTWRVACAGLAHELAQIVSEPIFDVPRLVEAESHERFDSFWAARPIERSDARIPPGSELNVRWQAGIDEALGVGDRPPVEPGDPGRERLNECVQFAVGQGAIDIAIGFGLVSSDVFRTQQNLKCAVSANESGQAGHGAATGNHPHSHFPLRDDGPFAAGETHVTSQRNLAAVAGRPAADEGNGDHWRRVRRTRKSGQGGKPVGPAGIEIRSSSLAVKSE